MNKRQKEDLELILRTKQSRTLLIYNMIGLMNVNREYDTILRVLESELKELEVTINNGIVNIR